MHSQQQAFFLESKFGQFSVRKTGIPKPGPGELLVKLEASALNPLDWKIQAYGLFVEKYPAVLGFDTAGVVVEIGDGVAPGTFSVGDRVFVQGWIDAESRGTRGVFLQYNTFPAKFSFKIPDTMSFENAATLPSGVATAAFPLYNWAESAASARLTAPWLDGGRGKYVGKSIFIFGGATVMAQFAIQFARLSGFSTIVAVASLHNSDLLKGLGATHVLDRKLSADSLREESTKIAGGLFDIAYDAVSLPETLPISYSLTKPHGDLVTLLPPGNVQDGDEASGKRVHMASAPYFVMPVNHEICVSLLESLPRLIEAGDIKPVRTEVLPDGLHGIPAGLERLRNGQVSGAKVVAKPQETV